MCSMFRAAFSIASVGAVAALTAVSCNKSQPDAAPAATVSEAPAPAPKRIPLAGGPRLAILAGQGVGPIRIGASVATIERLMQAPCEEKSPTLCRYFARAVDFELGPDGMTTRIHVHRDGRSSGVGKTFGVFNGAIPPDLRMNMTVGAVQQFLGPPDKLDKDNKGAAPETAEQHHYKGMVLEYDRLDNGKLVLGGVRIPD